MRKRLPEQWDSIWQIFVVSHPSIFVRHTRTSELKEKDAESLMKEEKEERFVRSSIK
jgi:hypothetical protein